MVVFGMSERDVREVLTHPLSMVASDGWTMTTDSASYAHPRNFAYTARFLSHYVRDESLIDLEHAIKKLATWPARRVGLRDRGELTPGSVADVVVFDLEYMSEESTFAQPCQHPKGFEFVLVSGQLAVDGGKTTGLRPGRVLTPTR
jgi:N-acyl-D-amino-acid deacylase